MSPDIRPPVRCPARPGPRPAPRAPAPLALLAPIALLSALLAVGCAPIRDNEALAGKRNDPCQADIACGPGLVCAQDGTCQGVGDPGTTDLGDACVADDECRFGYLCSGNGRCGTVSLSPEGERCLSDRACEAGLVCARDGSCAQPGAEGTAPLGDGCAEDAECGYALICGPEGVCAETPRWGGVECSDVEVARPQILFDVPRGEVPAMFYTMPYPNDVRMRAGTIDRAGFPGADVMPEPGEMLGRYLSAVREDGAAFGPNSAVIFRFSGTVDFGTLDFGGDDPNFLFVDITPNGESRGRSPRSRFYATGGRDRYICNNWLGIRPSEGTPLTYGNTYAVVFRRGLTDDNGTPLEPSPDQEALLGGVPPVHPALVAAWQRYAPLRDWLAEDGIPSEDIIAAAVFTVGDPRARLAVVRDAVHAAPSPAVEEAVACDGGASPCAERSCPAAGGATREYHARLSLPGFLQGVPPYADWGGEAVYVDGAPRVQRAESVCAVLTTPSGDAPAGGWPVAIFAHDLGGEARTAVDAGLADRLAEAGWATLSYDGVLQGARHGGDGLPDAAAAAAVLDEPARPGLMRDQMVQGAADLFALVRLLQGGVELPGGGALSTEQLAFVGHGRGGVYGVPFLAYEPAIRAGVLAAVGGDLVDWLQKRTAPRNLAAELLQAFAERDFNGMHPALHLMQTWLDPRDPVHYGTLLRRPPEGLAGKHLLYLYGHEDPITPPSTMNHMALALRLQQVGEGPVELTAITVAADDDGNPLAEVRGNARVRGADRTQVLRQYVAGDDSDGHRVLFDHPAAAADLTRFFEGLLDDPEGIPTVRAE